MKAAHVYATYVETRREGITNNIAGLCDALRRQRMEVRLDAPKVRLRELNNRATHITKGWASSQLLGAAFDDPSVDLVHHHVSIAAMGIWGRIAKLRTKARKPLLVQVWNAVFRPEDTFGAPPRRELAYHRVFNNPGMASTGLEGADALLVSSRFQERQLQDAGVETPIHIVSNGVDTDTYRPATREEHEIARAELGLSGDPVILYFGHLSAWKGVRHFVDAIPSVLHEHPRSQVLIAHTSYGNGEHALREQLRRLDIADRVLIQGPSDVPKLLAAADVAVLPSMAAVGTACHPNVLLEILSAGIPAVASRVGTIPEVIVDRVTGYLTRPGDATDIAAHLNLLADDEGLRRRVGAEARRDMLENFTWDVIAEKVNDVYLRYVDEEASPSPEPARREDKATDPETVTA